VAAEALEVPAIQHRQCADEKRCGSHRPIKLLGRQGCTPCTELHGYDQATSSLVQTATPLQTLFVRQIRAASTAEFRQLMLDRIVREAGRLAQTPDLTPRQITLESRIQAISSASGGPLSLTMAGQSPQSEAPDARIVECRHPW
jgi:hypothetical protein